MPRPTRTAKTSTPTLMPQPMALSPVRVVRPGRADGRATLNVGHGARGGVSGGVDGTEQEVLELEGAAGEAEQRRHLPPVPDLMQGTVDHDLPRREAHRLVEQG